MTGFALLLVTICVTWAAICDVRYLTIPNQLHLIMIGLLPGAFALDPGFQTAVLDDLWLRLVLGVAMLALGFCLFAKGWLGGGDAKLLAVLSLWIGSTQMAGWMLAITL